MRTPIISSFSTNYELLLEKLIMMFLVHTYLDITNDLLPDLLYLT